MKHYKNRIVWINGRYYKNIQPLWRVANKRYYCTSCGTARFETTKIERSENFSYYCNICDEEYNVKGRDKVPTEAMTHGEIRCDSCKIPRYLNRRDGELFCPDCET